MEHGHGPIVKALVRACGGQVGNWPRLLPYALWADRTTHSSVTGYMPAELMFGQVDWRGEMSREELLTARIRQFQRRPEDVERAAEKLRMARIRNKAGSTERTGSGQGNSRKATGC